VANLFREIARIASTLSVCSFFFGFSPTTPISYTITKSKKKGKREKRKKKIERKSKTVLDRKGERIEQTQNENQTARGDEITATRRFLLPEHHHHQVALV
jgi:hypothetical protein